MSKYWKTYWDLHVAQVPKSDVFRRVLRVQQGRPQSSDSFLRMVDFIGEKLQLEKHHRLLDLCCGNGLISLRLSDRCQHVVGVDFSEGLTEDLAAQLPPNVSVIVGDATEIAFRPGSFERILVAAALQHFSQSEVICLFEKFRTWLRPAGLVLITDILDQQQIWSFFDTAEREDVYFGNIKRGSPVLGTWFDRRWLEKLCRHAGFARVEVLEQPTEFWYSHYRFDLVFGIEG